MRNLVIILLLIAVAQTSVFGQLKYQNGYVVTVNNDTIYGQLRDRSHEPFGKIFRKVRVRAFWIFERRYGPKDLNSYKIGKDIYKSIWYDSYTEAFSVVHQSIPGSGKKIFMRLTASGRIDLYWDYFKDPEDGFELEVPFFKKPNSTEMIRVTQGILGFKKKQLANLFADCPELVLKMKDGQFDTPEQMVDFYNTKCF